MRKILVLVIFSTLFLPTNSASAENCPESWGYKIPELTFEKTTRTKGSDIEIFRSSSLGGGISTEDWQLNRPELFPEPFLTRIKNLGPDLAISAKYKVVNANREQIDFSGYGAGWTKSFTGQPDWLLLSRGVWNGTKIYYEMILNQKGCSPITLRSNVYTFSDMSISSFDFDDFFVKNPNGATDAVLNFKQVDILKSSIRSNIEIIKNAKEGTVVKLNSLRPLVGRIVGYLVVGLEPGGCVVGRNPYSSPEIDPLDIVIVQKPCKGGVLMSYELGGVYSYGLVTTFGLNMDSEQAQPKVPTPSGTVSPKVTTPLVIQKNQVKTIVCAKGKNFLRVTGVNPKCPSGHKLKK